MFFFFLCVCAQRRRRKQTSPSTRKGRQRCCAHSPGEKDRGARKGTFLCIYHQEGAACPTYSFSHRSCPKQHIWPELFDLVDFPRTYRAQFLPQSVDILNRHCLLLEAEISTFHPVSDGFLLSLGRHQMTGAVSDCRNPDLSLEDISVRSAFTKSHETKPRASYSQMSAYFQTRNHTDSLSYTDIKFNFSMGSISKPSKPQVFLAPYFAVVS